MTVTPVGAVAASTTASEGLEVLSIPLKVNIGFTSIDNHPISCQTVEPVALNVTNTLDPEELLTEGWRFTGTTVIPEIKCDVDGREDPSLGGVLSLAFSGSKNPLSLAITAPGEYR